ncbi:hypothetical protein DRJ17_01520 [Candidatus Woesearchaeota archaeon]|nr:MAG: hypothetical protein DRJ17_01520 [Candidatus Woesearchaeota archaeon]
MKQTMLVAITILTLVLFLVAGCEQPITPESTSTTEPASTPKKPEAQLECKIKGGTWREFSNACVDSCELVTDPNLLCAQVITPGCDCGPDKCWDDDTETCIPNPPKKSKEQLACENQGGVWKDFPDNCVDSCITLKKINPTCTAVITPGCDCGPDKCWDDDTKNCIQNLKVPGFIKLDRKTAEQKLQEAGCWYNLTRKSECIVFEDPYWIIQNEICLGKCKINAYTGEVEIDIDPMCMGLLMPGECQTDADCSKYTPRCATKYVCKNTSCVPSYE